MNRESENFEQLRRLIAIKRYEQPPPGYFHGFSREVILRIKVGEIGDSPAEPWWVIDGSWLHRLWSTFETRPAFAGSLGVAVCGFFVAGALLAESNDAPALAEAAPVAAPQQIAAQATLSATIPDPDFPNFLRISSPDIPRSSLFDRSSAVRWMPAPVSVNFTVPQN
jgi:hypothetical protein